MKAIIALLLMTTSTLAAEKATIIVCPPDLDYCYRVVKPIEPRKRAEDEMRDIQRWLDNKREELRRNCQMNPMLPCP